MRLYLDTADHAAAEDLLATGLFAGLTTLVEPARHGVGPSVAEQCRLAAGGERRLVGITGARCRQDHLART